VCAGGTRHPLSRQNPRSSTYIGGREYEDHRRACGVHRVLVGNRERPGAVGQGTGIHDLETKRFYAMEKDNVDTREGILSEDMIYPHANGKGQSRFDMLESLGSSEIRYKAIVLHNNRVRIYHDAAVVTERTWIRIQAQGR